MHVSFIPYGARWEVENLLREMEAQKHFLPMWKGKKKQTMPISGQIRYVPGGICEYVFPKESKDLVFNTFKGGIGDQPYLKELHKKIIRKFLKLKPIPKDYSKEKKYLWNLNCMGIIVLGMREDRDITDKAGEMIGWTHEGL